MKRKRIFTFVRVIISVSLLIFLIKKGNIDRTYDHIINADFKFYILMFVSLLLISFFQVIRWKVLLRNSSKNVKLLRLFKYQIIGIFFQSFLPSSMAVEVIKGHQLSKDINPKEAYASVVFGKIIGVGVLMFFFIFCLIFIPQTILGKGYTNYIIWFMIIIILILSIVFSKKVSRVLFGRFSNLFDKGIFKRVKDFRNALYSYRYDLKTLLISSLLTIGIFFGSILSAYFSYLAVGFNVPFIITCIYIPLVFMLMLIPIGINGIGVREGFMLLFFMDWGMTEEIILSSSVLNYSAVYSLAIVGGIVYFINQLKGVSVGKEKE